jgi:hypothetical protein
VEWVDDQGGEVKEPARSDCPAGVSSSSMRSFSAATTAAEKDWSAEWSLTAVPWHLAIQRLQRRADSRDALQRSWSNPWSTRHRLYVYERQ